MTHRQRAGEPALQPLVQTSEFGAFFVRPIVWFFGVFDALEGSQRASLQSTHEKHVVRVALHQTQPQRLASRQISRVAAVNRLFLAGFVFVENETHPRLNDVRGSGKFLLLRAAFRFEEVQFLRDIGGRAGRAAAERVDDVDADIVGLAEERAHDKAKPERGVSRALLQEFVAGFVETLVIARLHLEVGQIDDDLDV